MIYRNVQMGEPLNIINCVNKKSKSVASKVLCLKIIKINVYYILYTSRFIMNKGGTYNYCLQYIIKHLKIIIYILIF